MKKIAPMIKNRFLKFCLVGGGGFTVEAVIIYIFQVTLPSFILYARAVSFPAALLFTWLANRLFVFDSEQSKKKELFKYVVVQTTGAGINILVYTLLIYKYSFFASFPVIALMFGSGIAMFFNYFCSVFWVFVYDRDEKKL